MRSVAGGKDYAGKPRPVVIVQDDRFDAIVIARHDRATRLSPNKTIHNSKAGM